MLADLLQVEQRILQATGDGGHAAEGGSLELLGLEERLGVLEQADVVATDRLDEMLGRRELTEGNAKMVGIIEGVEQVLVWDAMGRQISLPLSSWWITYGRDGYPVIVGSHRGWRTTSPRRSPACI